MAKAVYFLAGSDEFAVKSNAAALALKIGPDDPMNVEIIDASADTVDGAEQKIAELQQAVLTLPFFGGPKLVWWKNVSFLADTVQGRSERVKEALEKVVTLLEKVDPTSVIVLISAIAPDKRRSFYKSLSKLAETQVFDLPDLKKIGAEEATFQIEDQLRKFGLEPGRGVAERLFESLGYDPRTLAQEMEKLLCHRGGPGPISVEDVRLLVGTTREAIAFDLGDSVLAGKPQEAIEHTRQLLAQEESPVGVLILLAGQVRMAALGCMLLENKHLRLGFKPSITDEGESLLPRKKSGEATNLFYLGRITERAKRRPAKEWFRALGEIERANKKITSGGADAEQVLELLVLAVAR